MSDIQKNKNIDFMKLSLDKLKSLSKIQHLGGGQKNLDKQIAMGKMTARQRIDYLLDKDAKRLEIGEFAGYGMYQEVGGCVSGGVIVVMGQIAKRTCIVVANDASVKAGAWFPITAKKNLRAQEIAMENEIPIIYLVDSAGVFLPMQDEIFPDKEHFGRIFRNNAKMSSMGIIQIAAIMGSCVAGGAYLPIMSDESLIVDKTGSVFLAGSYLVKAAIGEDIDNETLGGAVTHTEISGVCDYNMPDDASCLDKIKSILSKIPQPIKFPFQRDEPKSPRFDSDDAIYQFVSKDNATPYDMKELLEAIVDDSQLDIYKENYGQSIICAYARIDGWSVGIVANQRKVIKNKKGEMQFGGVIYSDSADKAARFIMNCNQKKIPLVFLQDVTGFMVGSRSEHGGIIKDGAKLVNAISNSTVPKFTVIIGNSYGAGNYAMCGKAYDPRLIVAWPSAKIAVMGGLQAGKTLAQIELASLEKKGLVLSDAEKQAKLEEITQKFDETSSSYYAASRLWVDAIIDPKATRNIISIGIQTAQYTQVAPFNLGVIQT
ncbi:MAG: acyl-CoA carboxylase subunit beta [Chitinophagales bacterium]|nr:acyl-CoA carboxylase subunit beta [Chitinophagales bacterium]